MRMTFEEASWVSLIIALIVGIALFILIPIIVIWAFNVVVLHPFGRHLDTNIWSWLAMLVLLLTIKLSTDKEEDE